MSIIATKPEGNFKMVAPGNYVARCYRMIEIGTVEEVYNGQAKMSKKVLLTWELPTEMEIFHEGKGYEPYVVSKKYTLSMHEKSNLRKDLESWRGKGFTELEAARFDITKLLGVPCLLQVIHKPGKADPSRMYSEIASITSLPKWMECPAPLNDSVILSFDDWKPEVFEGLSENMKSLITSSVEYRQMDSGSIEPVDVINDLPF